MTQGFVPGQLTRRTLVRGAAMMSAMQAIAPAAFAQNAAGQAHAKLKLSLFSKILQWTDVKEAASIAKELGFDALDLTVRPKGHVLPERVENDLPHAVAIVRAAGLEVSMISTEITSVNSPYAEALLKSASQLGIRNYRWGGLTYKGSKGITEQLEELKPQVRALAELNRKYGICGMYHTHSGPGVVGGPIWDLWILLQGLDPRWIGMNYDIGHATIEGGFGGWQTSAELAKQSMRGIALKDFRWPPPPKTPHGPGPGSKSGNGQYEPEWCPIGEGIVDFREFFRIIKNNGFSGPVQMHFEYTSLGGAENGEEVLHIPRAQLLAAIRRDLDFVKGVMRTLELV